MLFNAITSRRDVLDEHETRNSDNEEEEWSSDDETVQSSAKKPNEEEKKETSSNDPIEKSSEKDLSSESTPSVGTSPFSLFHSGSNSSTQGDLQNSSSLSP